LKIFVMSASAVTHAKYVHKRAQYSSTQGKAISIPYNSVSIIPLLSTT
jgi:hypothetical protein